MDPCNLHPGEAETVANRIDHELDRARGDNAPHPTRAADRRKRRFEALLRWPD